MTPATGAAELRQALAALADQGQMLAAPFFYALFAELEAQALGSGKGRWLASTRVIYAYNRGATKR